jgi:CubicO group peptidase (beta-lactamase class C family)
MKKLMAFVCPLLMLGIGAFAQDITQKLDSLVQGYVNVQEFNGSVLVARNGQVLLEKGYGFKNLKGHSLNDAGTVYPIASVTKTFTSTLVLQLAELQQLSLQDKLSKFYPGYPHGDSITIEQLLTHTSGIYNYTRNSDFMFKESGKPASEEKMLSLFRDKPLDFEPGTDWNYSNSGYSLLGYIIQKVTGMSYQQAMRKYVFGPLHMDHTGFDFARLPDSDKAIGYYAESGKNYNKETPLVDSSVSFSAGSICSNVADMYKWSQGLQHYEIVSKDLQDKACVPLSHHYGYGWMIDSIYGKRIVSHSGGIYGFRSNFARITDDNICIILLGNTETPGLDGITKSLLAILYNKPYQIPVKKQAVTVDESILKLYTGTYEIKEPQLVIEVKLENGGLVAYPFHGPKSEMAASDQTHFFDKSEEEIEIFFEKDEKGQIARMVINMHGTIRAATKIK